MVEIALVLNLDSNDLEVLLQKPSVEGIRLAIESCLALILPPPPQVRKAPPPQVRKAFLTKVAHVP